jgi:membrane-associated phospholipid phosphatase
MDTRILQLLNGQLASPLLDGLMLLCTTFGLALAPIVALVLIWRGRRAAADSELARRSMARRLGWTLVLALGATLLATLAFQLLALRSRPEGVRLLLATPAFPSFPSGHASLMAAWAMVLTLALRRWRLSVCAWLLTALVAISRVYLGHHYPSDLFAGLVLGAGIGAATYGFTLAARTGRFARLRWLLWPQLAAVVLISQLAYMRLLPMVPLGGGGDKVLHFVFMGSLALGLDLWLRRRDLVLPFSLGSWRPRIPLALPITAFPVLIEEVLQGLSPARSFELADLAADLGGMVLWLLVWRLATRSPSQSGESAAAARRAGAGGSV